MPLPRPKKKTQPKSRKRQTVAALPPAKVAAAVKTMAAPSGTARFAAGKALAITAAKDPARVYPYFDEIAPLLESDSKVVCWNAMQILASLAPADDGHRLDSVLDSYLAFIRGGNLVSAANAIGGSARIGKCRPDLLDRILPAILGAERAVFGTAECRNVAIQQTLDALLELGPDVCRRPEVIKFISRQTTNPRPAAAKRARQLMADLGP